MKNPIADGIAALLRRYFALPPFTGRFSGTEHMLEAIAWASWYLVGARHGSTTINRLAPLWWIALFHLKAALHYKRR